MCDGFSIGIFYGLCKYNDFFNTIEVIGWMKCVMDIVLVLWYYYWYIV